nr:MAG TPA: hypothetical protein [Caudoviricetes sp.]
MLLTLDILKNLSTGTHHKNLTILHHTHTGEQRNVGGEIPCRVSTLKFSVT